MYIPIGVLIILCFMLPLDTVLNIGLLFLAVYYWQVSIVIVFLFSCLIILLKFLGLVGDYITLHEDSMNRFFDKINSILSPIVKYVEKYYIKYKDKGIFIRFIYGSIKGFVYFSIAFLVLALLSLFF